MINFNEILDEGIKQNASDIHLMESKRPIYRINRDLIEKSDSKELTEKDLNEIFNIFTANNSGLVDNFNHEKRLDLNYEHKGIRFRVNISLSFGKYVFTMRIIKNELPIFNSLGLPIIVRKLAMLNQGLILITGKSNSGKTTTLNALVNEINHTENKKIMMLEDPIEFAHTSIKSMVVQKEVGEGKDCLSFSEGAMNALREDCDILVVGEIRDKKTMDALLEISESGYLVFGTLHTRSCAETIDRILGFYDVDDQKSVKYMLSSVLKAVISQRLLKGINNDLVMTPEIMVVDDIISGHIRKEKLSKSEIEDAILTGQSKGSLSLIFSLANQVVKNRISLETAQSQIEERYYEHLNNTIYRMKNNLFGSTTIV